MPYNKFQQKGLLTEKEWLPQMKKEKGGGRSSERGN